MVESDRRVFKRIFLNKPVNLYQNDKIWKCQLIDISMKGVLLQTPEEFINVTDNNFNLSILLSQEEIKVDMVVTFVHSNMNQTGFYCKEIDMDSLSHLRRLMELNLGDVELVNRELAELCKGRLNIS